MLPKNIIDLKESIKNRIIEKTTFDTNPPIELNLSSQVVVYQDGRNYKVIPVEIFKSFPLIYDNYYDISSNDSVGILSNITIYLCPFTFYSVIYHSKFISNDQVYNNNLILENINDPDLILIPILEKFYQKPKFEPKQTILRKTECKITTLKNVITKFPDCLFLHFKGKLNPLLYEKYYYNLEILYPIDGKKNNNLNLNNIHPKKIIYGIEYKSNKEQDYKIKHKYAAIVGKNNGLNINDIHANGIEKYLLKMGDKIRNKSGLVTPCFWFAWLAFHPETKIIHL